MLKALAKCESSWVSIPITSHFLASKTFSICSIVLLVNYIQGWIYLLRRCVLDGSFVVV